MLGPLVGRDLLDVVTCQAELGGDGEQHLLAVGDLLGLVVEAVGLS